jgi:phosphohistidine phosphatase
MPRPTRAPVLHLWLLRHGKAASDAPWGGSDKDRPLTGRGRRDATALGSRLVGQDRLPGLDGVPTPELVVCSAAVRTRQTADLIVEAMGGGIQVDSYHSLYGADTELLLRYLREVDEGVRSALVVGHNPTVYQFAWELLDDDDDGGGDGGGSVADRSVLEANGFPTCALAVLALEVTAWEDVIHGCARLVGLFRPPY